MLTLFLSAIKAKLYRVTTRASSMMPAAAFLISYSLPIGYDLESFSNCFSTICFVKYFCGIK